MLHNISVLHKAALIGTLLTLAGCAGQPKVETPPAAAATGETASLGERMSRVSSKMTLMSQQWDEGKKLVEQGRSTVEKGRGLMEQGQDMIKRGEEMQRESEAYFREHGGQP